MVYKSPINLVKSRNENKNKKKLLKSDSSFGLSLDQKNDKTTGSDEKLPNELKMPHLPGLPYKHVYISNNILKDERLSIASKNIRFNFQRKINIFHKYKFHRR